MPQAEQKAAQRSTCLPPIAIDFMRRCSSRAFCGGWNSPGGCTGPEMTSVIHCDDWQYFKTRISDILGEQELASRPFIFRGQADDNWGITSSFDRHCPGTVDNRDSYYENKLAFFAYQLRQYGEDLDLLSRGDRGAIAQHYGMPTRLIDWSTSPYVAAFMAFFSALTENRLEAGSRIAIWSLDVERFRALCPAEAALFRIVKTRLLQNDRVWR
jgi:hypothetical protein